MATQLSEPIQFGKYTLFERIGRGGMAEVYKGRIQGPGGFERVFVVKRVLPHLSDDGTFIKMLVEEAKLSARLNHPNIVHIFELGTVDGEYFISMEHIHGHDLSETMRAIWKTMGPPRPELVAYIGREACRGLHYAHRLTDEQGHPLGMIHRDVSPSNVMLSYEGAVKLLDFGIAKALGDTGEITKSGTMKGKYAYMAPEQTEGDNVDHRSDIFSCGIVLHEVLTGRRLFKGQNDVQTIERVRRCEVPRPSLQNRAVPPELDAIVLKALARQPEDRWQSAGEMADALDNVVYAARFQPMHLAQLLYDLFPVDGAAPPHAGTTSPSSSSALSHISTISNPSSILSRTVPPISRTASGAGALSFDSAGLPGASSLKPKSRLPTALILMFVAGGGAVGAWKYLSPHPAAFQMAVPSDPSRRFHVYVKSEPEGADIFLNDGKRPIGATPVTLPVDLTGVSSVHLLLKKDGYEDYEQIVVNDDPLSIVMTPKGVTPQPPPVPVAPDKGGTAKSAAERTDRKVSGKAASNKKAAVKETPGLPLPAAADPGGFEQQQPGADSPHTAN